MSLEAVELTIESTREDIAAIQMLSYSLYFTHVITLSGLAYAWSNGGFYHLGAPVFAMIGVALSILGSIVCYRQVELRASTGLDHLIRNYEMRATRSRS